MGGVEIARGAATDAGLADPRVTSDAKHVEIGITDKSNSGRWIMRELWRSGIAPTQVLIAGDEPSGVPAGVVRLGEGPDMFAAIVEDQMARRRHGELPIVDPDRGDQLTGTVGDRGLNRVAAYEGAARGPADGHVSPDRLKSAQRLGFDGLLAEHRRAWASRWEDADVLIDGDPELQLAVRFAIFHLLASAPDHGEAAVGARGLSGTVYRGHVFWDTDVYVLPMLAATHPQAARAILEYRVRRLPAAIQAARRRCGEGGRPVPVGVRAHRSRCDARAST